MKQRICTGCGAFVWSDGTIRHREDCANKELGEWTIPVSTGLEALRILKGGETWRSVRG